MRGSPLFRAALVLVALLLLIFPLRSLTNRPASSAGVAETVAPASAVQMAITSTTFPFHFSISHLGRVIWSGESSTGRITKELALVFPPEGIDLVLEASWVEKKETAVRLEVARAEGAPIARTLWGTERVNDVVTFQP